MKTKKISWQAIAIVVLALVLIASIALGVSGAWFQDADSASDELTLGHAVTIRLADTDNSDNKPVSWSQEYTGSAYPGDLVFGKTSIIPGEVYDTNKVSAAAYRIKIKAVVDESATGYNKDQTTEPTALTGTPTEAQIKEYNQKMNSYLINQMLAQATSDTFKTSWTEGKTAGSDGLKWYYYNNVNQSSTAIAIFEELRLSNKITNEAAGWKISVSVNVEAIQAANILAEGVAGNADWRDDMPTALTTAVTNYNTKTAADNGRLPNAD